MGQNNSDFETKYGYYVIQHSPYRMRGYSLPNGYLVDKNEDDIVWKLIRIVNGTYFGPSQNKQIIDACEHISQLREELKDLKEELLVERWREQYKKAKRG